MSVEDLGCAGEAGDYEDGNEGEDEVNHDLIPECSNDMGEITTIRALVRMTQDERFEADDRIVHWLNEARAGGRNGGFIEPMIDALAERTGLPKARIVELERGSRSYLDDIATLVREAVAELGQQYPQAVAWRVAEPAPGPWRPGIQHVRLVTAAGQEEDLDLEWWMAEVFFDSRANWMQMELVVDLVGQVITAGRSQHGRASPGGSEAA